MGNDSPADRIAWLETALREIGQICMKLGSANSEGQVTDQLSAPPSSMPIASPAVTEPTSPIGDSVDGAGPIRLSTFLTRVTRLTPDNRLTIVDAAIAMLSGVFVHLPLKKAMHGWILCNV